MVEQLPLFDINDQFIFVFQSIMTNGLLAKIKPNALAVHMTMKCHSFRTGPRMGCADISVAKISKICGITESQVKTAVKNLIEHRYIQIVDAGGKTTSKLYRIFDLLPYHSRDRKIEGILMSPYHPYELREQREEIQRFARTGKLSKDTGITNIIINGDLHFNIYIGDNVINTNMQSPGSVTTEEFRNRVGSFLVERVLQAQKDETGTS